MPIRYNSFTYPQSGFELKDGKLTLSKIGTFKVIQHRKIEGKIKTCIKFEDLQIKNMVQNHCVAKSINDAGWYQLMQFTKYKAEYAGKFVEFFLITYFFLKLKK